MCIRDRFYKCADFHAERGDMAECAKILSQARGMAGRNARHVLKHSALQALVNQHAGKFLVAARGYLKVAMHDDAAVRTGVICAILGVGQVGGDREAVMADYLKDPRTQGLDVSPFLEKAVNGRLFRKDAVDAFVGMLEPHQAEHFIKVAVLEHNIQSISQIYQNISLEQLGLILNVSKEDAEKAASTIISEGRLSASINQLDDLLTFDATNDEFSANIRDTCMAVQGIVGEIPQ
eukprot:TRINITY_DN6872_c0_g1_i1.p1 TRINITY_DN6872_c0_g1~~TRINITY_DN6872_c0_g1_i1.p1  ORF type:complete len:235 (+),score=71.96 TRINITY_DN6872_c0_g1_i1:192-896(+)